MITRISIQKAQTLTTRRGINNPINTRESKRVSRTGLIKVYLIHRHTPSVVFLKYQHRVSQPLRMKNFNDETYRQEPGHFFTNGLTPLLIEAMKELLDRLNLRINIKSVLSEFPRYTWHVRRLPCKDVPVLTDELDERAFLFGIQISTDTELLG